VNCKREIRRPAATPGVSGAGGTLPRATRAPDPPVHGAPVLSASEGYALWAPNYDSDPNPLLALEQRALSALLPFLAGKAALDIACGTGRWLQALVRGGARPAIGVDLSSAMLRVAGTKPLLKGCLMRADVRSLPLGFSLADIILISFAACHIAELTALAGELARVAKRGAYCYLTDLHPAAYARGWRVGFRQPGGPGEILTFGHSGADIREAFCSQGFDVIRFYEHSLGEPERPTFARAGRLDRFAEVAGIPAVLICHFQRRQIGNGDL
jgi:malonyl-CoA O-methyltransferase